MPAPASVITTGHGHPGRAQRQLHRLAGSPAQLEIVAEAIHGFTLFPLTITRRELEQ